MKRWNKKELAKRIGASGHPVSSWERDVQKPYKIKHREKLVEELKLDPDKFERLMKINESYRLDEVVEMIGIPK